MKTITAPHRQNPSEYATRDIYLASVIRQAGIPLIRVDGNGRQGIFVFENSPEIAGILSGYFNDQMRVSPRQLFESWKTLKSLAFASIGDVR